MLFHKQLGSQPLTWEFRGQPRKALEREGQRLQKMQQSCHQNPLRKVGSVLCVLKLTSILEICSYAIIPVLTLSNVFHYRTCIFFKNRNSYFVAVLFWASNIVWRCISTQQHQTKCSVLHHTVPHQQQRPNFPLPSMSPDQFKSIWIRFGGVGQMCSRQCERPRKCA